MHVQLNCLEPSLVVLVFGSLLPNINTWLVTRFSYSRHPYLSYFLNLPPLNSRNSFIL
jgi:hypothetical protein